jgi:hypothetical protein
MSKSNIYFFGATAALVAFHAAIFAVLAVRQKKKEEKE